MPEQNECLVSHLTILFNSIVVEIRYLENSLTNRNLNSLSTLIQLSPVLSLMESYMIVQTKEQVDIL